MATPFNPAGVFTTTDEPFVPFFNLAIEQIFNGGGGGPANQVSWNVNVAILPGNVYFAVLLQPAGNWADDLTSFTAFIQFRKQGQNVGSQIPVNFTTLSGLDVPMGSAAALFFIEANSSNVSQNPVIMFQFGPTLSNFVVSQALTVNCDQIIFTGTAILTTGELTAYAALAAISM